MNWKPRLKLKYSLKSFQFDGLIYNVSCNTYENLPQLSYSLHRRIWFFLSREKSGESTTSITYLKRFYPVASEDLESFSLIVGDC